ncbi:fungal specific transcription factor domain-containing protein [Geosmithia morbida]|uniref:Fungal specific transcription factor domain-containing protein n=1 Tax=Geosmithia morbida TaxID=1094350 RepID=A0A9P4YSB6_9HYPO|nr:fungal specific transcription factor domain-containing protein [Geosmithia morbida]KAF4120746.1 fungal specific transcription factor domain-containing protein [Geosmithia morbida]
MFSTFRSIASEPVQGSTHTAPRKRAQVRRACDACRLARVKCDLTRPCRNCLHSGRECVSSGVVEFKNVSSATREVERLRDRLRELESLKRPVGLGPSPASASSSEDDNRGGRTVAAPVTAEWKWKGMVVDGLRYGPLSLQYFIHRASSYMGCDIGAPPPPINVLSARNVDLRGCDLTRQQQDYFVDLFWTAYHVSYPVVDADDFKPLYDSLWDVGGLSRRPDPLVDIVLAISIQYAFSLMGIHDPATRSEAEQADQTERPELAVAGSPFFHRCQDGLDHLMESPDVKTVQCMFLSATYLSYARCYNAAHTTVKTARHVASALGVGDSFYSTDKCVLTRTARCLRVLDSRISMRLGRVAQTCSAVALRDPSYVAPSHASAVFHDQLLLLCELAEDVYRCFMDQANHLFGPGRDNMYSDVTMRNEAGLIMTEQMKRLHEWTKQRHRITLECHYHDVCLTLLRIFICFSPIPVVGACDADKLCVRCVDHAFTLTTIISQASRETDIIKGCFQAFEWQENATYALAGFAIAYPACQTTLTARRSLATASRMFEQSGSGTPASVRMRRLCSLLDAEISNSVVRLRESIPAVIPTPPGTDTSVVLSSGAITAGVSQTPEHQDRMRQNIDTCPLLYPSPDWDSIQADFLNSEDFTV